VKRRALGAPLVRAQLWAAIVIGLATRAALAAPTDDLADPPPATPPRADTPPAATAPPNSPASSPAPPAVPTAPPPTDAEDEPMPPALPPVPAPKPRPPVPARQPLVAQPPSPAPPPPAAPGPVPWPTVPSGQSSDAGNGVARPAVVAAPTPAGPSGAYSLSGRTQVGFYGEAQLFVDAESNKTARLPEVVFSVTHRPTDWFRIVAALEADDGTSLALQQAFFEIAPTPFIGLRAGLMIVPLGLANLVPEPAMTLTVDRPLTDQLIVPSIWRELGVGIFGELGPGLRYQGEVLSGLDGRGFSAEAPLWGGRGDGSGIAVHDAAFAGRLELVDRPPGLVIGGGGYYGNATAGLEALGGLHVGVLEADARYHRFGFDLRAEVARLYIVNSYLVNNYLGLLGQDAVPARGRGFYLQGGYDLLRLGGLDTKQELVMFAGYENVDARSEMSQFNYNPPAITGPGQLAPEAPSPIQQFVRGGIDYRPWPAIALKADVQVAIGADGPVPAAPMVVAGAPGTPRPIGADVADAARGRTRVGLALAFSF
jgi:hypothetical protein